MIKPEKAIIICVIFLIQFSIPVFSQVKSKDLKVIGHGYDFEGNGKDSLSKKQIHLYQLDSEPDGMKEALKAKNNEGLIALRIQAKFLSHRSGVHKYENLSFTDESIKETVEKLINIKEGRGPLSDISDLKLYRVEGDDGKGNVHFTAYFTPVLEARKKPDSIFKYPFYRSPLKWIEPRPTRAMIDTQGILANQGLEIAWTSSLLQNYFIHVQGSAYLRFEDGSLYLLLFDGQNGYAYTSIGNYMVSRGYIDASEISLLSIKDWFANNPDSLTSVLNLNKSYCFFRVEEDVPRGAAGTELVAGHSIAVDPKYIPVGAVLLAKVPVLDLSGRLQGHEFRLVTAQDRGGAINGPGHVDVYEGVGAKAELKAGSLHHYGTLWLILADHE